MNLQESVKIKLIFNDFTLEYKNFGFICKQVIIIII